MSAEEAAAFLDNSPEITFSVWCALWHDSQELHPCTTLLGLSAAQSAPGGQSLTPGVVGAGAAAGLIARQRQRSWSSWMRARISCRRTWVRHIGLHTVLLLGAEYSQGGLHIRATASWWGGGGCPGAPVHMGTCTLV